MLANRHLSISCWHARNLQIRQRAKGGEQFKVGTMKIPMIDLPLGATEDRVCGTIDIEKALTEGGCGA